MTQGTTIAPVGRKPSELSADYRRRLRRIHRRAESSEAELRALVIAGREAGEPLAAIARELGLTKQKLSARVKSWKRGDSR